MSKPKGKKCSHWKAEKEEGERFFFFYTFCRISFLFPPWRLLSAECAEYAFHGKEAREPARIKNREKKMEVGDGEKGRRGETQRPKERRWREKRYSWPPAIQIDGVNTQKTSPPCFFSLFILEFPEPWAAIMTRILGPHTGYPHWRLEGRKNKCVEVKCTGLYFCPASRLIGVHVGHPMADWEPRLGGVRFSCRGNILQHLSWVELMTVKRLLLREKLDRT